VADTFRGVIIVVVHIDNYGALTLAVHEIPLFAECHFRRYGNIFDLLNARFFDEIRDLVRAIIHDDPFDALFRVVLVAETGEHGFDERSAIESGRAYADEGVIYDGFCICIRHDNIISNPKPQIYSNIVILNLYGFLYKYMNQAEARGCVEFDPKIVRRISI